MSNKLQQVMEIYIRHGLEYDELPEEDEISDLTSVLMPLSEAYLLCNWDATESIGAWELGKLHEDFSFIVDEVIRVGEGSVLVEEFVSKNDHSGDEFGGTISISFKHNNKTYAWSFSADDPVEYFVGITEWAKRALDKGYHCEYGEFLTAWYIKPEALKELKALVSC